MARALARLRRDRRGGVGVLVAFAMPLLAGMAAFAVDLGSVELDARRLQGVADAAALAAAGNPDSADAAARAIVAANWARASVVRTTRGRYVADAAVAVDQRFVAGSGDAAQAEVTTDSPTFFAAIFGQRSVKIVRRATAQRRQLASFAIGSRLVGVDAPLLNALTGALLGNTVSLNLLDYQSFDTSRIDVFAFLDRVKLRANLSVNNYGDLLAADVKIGDVLGALADTLAGTGDTGAANAARSLAAAAPVRTIRLGALIDAGPLAKQASGAGGNARVPVLPFLMAALETGGARQIALDMGATVPGLVSLKLTVAIGERAQKSPWLSVSDGGATIVRTAQARIYARAKLQPTLLPGLAGLVSIDLPLFVQAAGAEARLKTIECGASPKAVTLEARVDPLDAVMGTVDETKLNDFSTVLTPTSAKLVDTVLVDVTGSSRVSLGAAEPWQALRFTQPMIDAATAQTIRTSTPVQGIAASLVGQAAFAVQVLGLPIPLDPLLKGLGGALGVVAPPIDTLLMTVTRVLGVGIGEADLTATGLRCGGAVLVG